MMNKFKLIVILFFSIQNVWAEEFAITWQNQKTITLKDGMVTMPGLRHQEEKFPANSCHRTYLTLAQKMILDPRFAADEGCIRDRSQTYDLVIGGKKQTVVTCTRLGPRFERLQAQMSVCSRQRDD